MYNPSDHHRHCEVKATDLRRTIPLKGGGLLLLELGVVSLPLCVSAWYDLSMCAWSEHSISVFVSVFVYGRG